jgi:protein-serine/threonine kinase
VLFSEAIEDPGSTTKPQLLSLIMHSSSPPLSPSHSWKSVFRLPSSSKKQLANVNGTPALDRTARCISSPLTAKLSSGPPPSPSLTPSTPQSVDQRSSYNSSKTQSSESNPGGTPKSSYLVPDSRGYPSQAQQSQQQPHGQIDMIAPLHAQPRVRTKSEKQRINLTRAPCLPASRSQTADSSQHSFVHPSGHGPSASRSGPLSPRAMGASATRFIRRVASAPNAKHLFLSGSRSAAPTKNGLLAPADVMPPVPGGPPSISEYGDDSLETISSGSSRGRSTRHERYPAHGTPKTRIANPTAEGPGKVAFRRTYSSNSIKVRSVCFLPYLHLLQRQYVLRAGGGWTFKLPQNQDAGQRRRRACLPGQREENGQVVCHER